MEFKKNAIESILVQAMVSVLNFACVGFTARSLDVSDAGVIFVALGIAVSINTFAGLGLHQSVTIFAQKYTDAKIITNGLISLLISSLLAFVCACGIVFLFSIPKGLKNLELSYGLLVSNQLIHAYLLAFLRAIKQFRTSNRVSLIQPLMINLIFLYWFGLNENKSLIDVIKVYTWSFVLPNLVVLVLMCKSKLILFSVLDTKLVLDCFKSGSQVQYGNLFKEAMYRADLFLVSIVLGDKDAGLYAVVLKMIEGFGRFVDAVGMVMLPIVAQGNKSSRDKLKSKVLVATIICSLICAGVVFASKRLLVATVFGQEFSGSIKLLAVGIFAMIPLFVWKMLAIDSIGRSQFGQYCLSAGLGAGSSVLLNIYFLPKYGVVAASWILIFSYSFAALSLFAFARLNKNR